MLRNENCGLASRGAGRVEWFGIWSARMSYRIRVCRFHERWFGVVMRRFALSRSARSQVGAFFALLAWVVVAPSQAQAGCLQHGLLSSEDARLSAFLDPLIAGTSTTSTDVRLPAPANPRPCSGPSCSGYPPGPTVPSVSVTRYVELWACLGLIVAPQRPRPTLAPSLPHRLHSVLAGSAVFHPPRVG